MREEICRECQGTGYVEYIAGSYYSEFFGNYLPREEIARCKVCDGTGYVEVLEEAGSEGAVPLSVEDVWNN